MYCPKALCWLLDDHKMYKTTVHIVVFGSLDDYNHYLGLGLSDFVLFKIPQRYDTTWFCPFLPMQIDNYNDTLLETRNLGQFDCHIITMVLHEENGYLQNKN